jgi:hypothetical protein
MANNKNDDDPIDENWVSALLMAQHLGPTRKDGRLAVKHLSELIEGPLLYREDGSSTSSN